MDFKQEKGRIAYPCIFCRTTAEAAGNLIRLITTGQCGYDEGPAAWQSFLQQCLEEQSNLSESDVSELNGYGTAFTAGEWREILTAVFNGLNKHLKRKERKPCQRMK